MIFKPGGGSLSFLKADKIGLPSLDKLKIMITCFGYGSLNPFRMPENL